MMTEFCEISPRAATLWLTVPCDWARPAETGEYQLFRDRELDFGQLLPRPDAQEVARFYEIDDYYTHRRGGGAGRPRSTLMRIADRLDRSVWKDEDWWRGFMGPQPARLLDIGAGSGTALDKARRLGHAVAGLEPDPAARAVASAAGHELHAGTAEELPESLAGRRFDRISLNHVLEHCLDPALALANARDLMEPGGRLAVETPNNACMGARIYGPCWSWLDVPRHLNFFTRRSLSQIVEEAGFEVEAVEHCGFGRQFSAMWIDSQARNARVFGLDPRDVVGEGRLWRHMLRAAFADPDLKYDSVRVIARRRA